MRPDRGHAERFYQRQFITRKISNHKILDHLEIILAAYFHGDSLVEKGLPTVQYIAEALNISPNYLSGLLKILTGQSTQQHIHDKLIEKVKEKLSATHLSVSEILPIRLRTSAVVLQVIRNKNQPFAF